MSIEAAMDHIAEVEPKAKIRDDDREQQHEVYEKTFRALEDVTPDDKHKGITVVADWIVEQIQASVVRALSLTGQRTNSYIPHSLSTSPSNEVRQA